MLSFFGSFFPDPHKIRQAKADEIVASLDADTDEDAVIDQIKKIAYFTHPQLIEIAMEANNTRHAKIAEYILNAALVREKVADKDLILYFDAFYYAESLTLSKEFIYRYMKMDKKLKDGNYTKIAESLYLEEDALLKKIFDDKFNGRLLKVMRVRLGALLKFGRFRFFNQAYEYYSKILSNDRDYNTIVPIKSELTFSEIHAKISENYTLTNPQAPLKNYLTQHNEKLLFDAMANIQYFLHHEINQCDDILKGLSQQLETALNAKKKNLAANLKKHFPPPQKSDMMIGSDHRQYPKVSSLNPNNVNLTKYSILKEILCQYLSDKGLLQKNASSADKYCGFVQDSNMIEHGLFEESLFTLINHGKLTHLMQWYIIGHAAATGAINLNGLSLPMVLDAFLSLKNENDQELWIASIDVININSGYSSPINLFQKLLISDSCLGSYMRSSVDKQLNHLLACYHKLPHPTAKEITRECIFYASICQGNFTTAIAPHLQDINSIVFHYYKEKGYNVIVQDNQEAAIIRNKPHI